MVVIFLLGLIKLSLFVEIHLKLWHFSLFLFQFLCMMDAFAMGMQTGNSSGSYFTAQSNNCMFFSHRERESERGWLCGENRSIIFFVSLYCCYCCSTAWAQLRIAQVAYRRRVFFPLRPLSLVCVCVVLCTLFELLLAVCLLHVRLQMNSLNLW